MGDELTLNFGVRVSVKEGFEVFEAYVLTADFNLRTTRMGRDSAYNDLSLLLTAAGETETAKLFTQTEGK